MLKYNKQATSKNNNQSAASTCAVCHEIERVPCVAQRRCPACRRLWKPQIRTTCSCEAMLELFNGHGKGDRAECAECRTQASITMVAGRKPRARA